MKRVVKRVAKRVKTTWRARLCKGLLLSGVELIKRLESLCCLFLGVEVRRRRGEAVASLVLSALSAHLFKVGLHLFDDKGTLTSEVYATPTPKRIDHLRKGVGCVAHKARRDPKRPRADHEGVRSMATHTSLSFCEALIEAVVIFRELTELKATMPLNKPIEGVLIRCIWVHLKEVRQVRGLLLQREGERSAQASRFPSVMFKGASEGLTHRCFKAP
jgi:hypothetical protein